eukprot:CAMPEP_0202388534 /NCGR_PEP_ID=MMETSP1127-20130417/78081_1 /ASSEMBLY_ACC=CAM_ASM_000462 /TAXON_ID=3047 /ORGANISM="Dunaliella tertiolecta, Strain CCMP1320" /LENGTH=50 /DNA_ID=CAMNT_0048989981 /DNA_START=186 /DNA_END=335 /DNA_ORIENTATION=-
MANHAERSTQLLSRRSQRLKCGLKLVCDVGGVELGCRVEQGVGLGGMGLV